MKIIVNLLFIIGQVSGFLLSYPVLLCTRVCVPAKKRPFMPLCDLDRCEAEACGGTRGFCSPACVGRWGCSFFLVPGFVRQDRGLPGRPLVLSLGEPFSSHAEVFAGFAVSAELVIPFFLAFGFLTRFAAMVGAIHFAVATYAHLVAWKQPFRTVVLSDTDPSGIGSLCWMLPCLLNYMKFGPGRF